MAGFAIDSGASLQCPHGGSVRITSTNTRVQGGNQYLTTMSDTFIVSGCPFQIPIGTGTKPSPCIRVQWVVPNTRVMVNGQPTLGQSSVGLCFSAESIPQGPVTVVSTQTNVSAL